MKIRPHASNVELLPRIFVEPAESTFEQKRDETKPALHLAAFESPFSRKKDKKSLEKLKSKFSVEKFKSSTEKSKSNFKRSRVANEE